MSSKDTLLITNANVWMNGKFQLSHVAISDGKVIELGEKLASSESDFENCINAEGKYLVPVISVKPLLSV